MPSSICDWWTPQMLWQRNLHRTSFFIATSRLAPDMVAELRLDHAERGFRIAALVVVLQEVLAAELVVVKHLLPQRARFTGRLLHLNGT